MSERIGFLCSVLLAVFGFFSCTPEDADSPQPEEFFLKYYGSNSSEATIDILPYNEGFLLLGSTNDHTDDRIDQDYLLIKTDALGNELWKRQINFVRNSAHGDDVPSEMILYDANNVAIVGTTKVNIGADILASRVFVTVVDVSGDTARVINDQLIFPEIGATESNNEILAKNSEGRSLLRPTDGVGALEDALFVLGSSDSVATLPSRPASDVQDIYMNKFDIDPSTFEVVNSISNFEDVFGFDGEDIGYKVLQFASEFVIIGSTDRASDEGGGGKNVFLRFVNLDGVTRNGPVFGDNSDEIPSDINVSGNLVTILGNRTSAGVPSAFIIQTTSSGTSATPSVISIDGAVATNTGNIGNGLIKLQNSDFFVTGQILGHSNETGSKQGEVLLYRIDQSGQIDDTSLQIFGGIGNDRGNTLIQNADQTLMIGATIDFQGGTTMMSLMKTNANGEFAK